MLYKKRTIPDFFLHLHLLLIHWQISQISWIFDYSWYLTHVSRIFRLNIYICSILSKVTTLHCELEENSEISHWCRHLFPSHFQRSIIYAICNLEKIYRRQVRRLSFALKFAQMWISANLTVLNCGKCISSKIL